MSEWEAVLSKCIDIVLDLMNQEISEDARYLLRQLLSELEALIPQAEGAVVELRPDRYRGIPA